MTSPIQPVSGSAGYIALPVTTDADALATKALTYLAQQQPGWVAREGHLEVWMIRAFARMCAETAQVAAQVPLSIFQYFGTQLMNLPPLTGSSASMQATFTLTDTQGHLIPAGTVVSYPAASTTNVLFQTTADVTVPAGSNATATGGVTLTAVTPGSAANGLAPRALSLVSNLAWVSSVVSTTASAGGTDAETQTAYINRLAADLQLMSPRPILPNDFAVLARNQAGVARAAAIDGYNTSNLTSGNSRTVGVSVVDSNGNALSSSQMTTISNALQAMREANFVVGVTAPTYNTVNITATLKAVSGSNTATVTSAAIAALQSYLSPANWGGPAPAWTNQTVVRYLTIAGLLDNIAGVSYVSSLQIGVGAGAMSAADGTLTGAFPLTQAGTITITTT